MNPARTRFHDEPKIATVRDGVKDFAFSSNTVPSRDPIEEVAVVQTMYTGRMILVSAHPSGYIKNFRQNRAAGLSLRERWGVEGASKHALSDVLMFFFLVT